MSQQVATATQTLRTKHPFRTFEVTVISVVFMGPVMAMPFNGIGVTRSVRKSVPFIFSIATLAYLDYVYVIQIEGQEPPFSYFPWVVGAWCVPGLIIVLAKPAITKCIGERLTTEDIDS